MEDINKKNLIEEIYKEVKYNNQLISDMKEIKVKLEKIENKLEEQDEKFEKIQNKLEENDEKFEKDRNNIIKCLMRRKFEKIEDEVGKIDYELKIYNERFSKIEKKLENIDKIEEKLDNIDKIEKLHFEYITNKFNRIEQKIDSNFKYLDEKIDNTKDKLVSNITDLIENFSINASKLIDNVENKIKNEVRERKIEISKVKGLNDYDRIILKNLESRISILEEESQKYQIN